MLELAGSCGGDIDSFCVDVMPGEGRLSGCLTKQIEDEEKGNTDGKKVSEDCKVELRAFKADRSSNINKNLELGAFVSCLLPCMIFSSITSFLLLRPSLLLSISKT